LERIIRINTHQVEMSLDTETTGLDTITAKILGYSFSFKENTAYWVSVKIDPQLKLLKQLIKKKTVIFFHAGYDLAIIEKYGVKIQEKNVRDVMIACFFRDIPDYHRNAGLKAQAHKILYLPTVELKEIIMANTGVKRLKSNEIDFTLLEPWQQRVYGCQDADITMQLWLHEEIQAATKMMPEIWELEHQLIYPVMEMYKNGIAMDVDKCKKFDAILEKECLKLSQKAHKIALRDCPTIKDDAGHQVFAHEKLRKLTKKKGLNLGSFTQKQIVLFEELKVPPTHRVSTGYSTDKRALTEIENSHEIIPLMQKYATYIARRNSYTKKLPSLLNPITGRIHPSLWATGTRSGRFSCSKPNMQGISSDRDEKDIVHIREMFITSKGNVLTAADYSQIELRVAASDSQEPVWCEAYNLGNIDVHRETASQMYEVPFKKVTAFERDVAKRANFAILTGTSAFMLHQRHQKAIPTQEKGQEIINRWFAALPQLADWIAAVKRRAGYERQAKTYFGRIRPLLEIRNPSEQIICEMVAHYKERAFSGGEVWAYDENTPEELWREAALSAIRHRAERIAVSHFIQGTAADIVKMAIIRTARAIRKEKMPVKMLLQVHDELLFEHSPKITDEVHGLLHETMEFKKDAIGPGWVPFTVDIGCGKNWAEAH